MEITSAKAFKKELEKAVAKSLKEYEKNTSLTVSEIKFVRQSSYDNLGNETDFTYVVEVKSNI